MGDTDLPMDMGLHFTASQLIASFIFGVIGLFIFRYGKKIVNYPVIFTGVALMVYPIFTSGPLQDWGVGVILCGLAYYFSKTGEEKTG